MKYKLYLPQAINEMGKRKNQEDCIYPAPEEATIDSRLFIVCDGMGGYEKGEVASAITASTISNFFHQHHDPDTPLVDNLFMDALNAAYDALDQTDHEEEKNKMGTTLTLLSFHRGGCLAAHIGDSRIYHLRPSTGEILYRSRDHSLVQQLYEMGELAYAEMKTSPQKNVVIKAMQPHQEQRVKADLVHITDIRPGDYFYLCTDGMLEQMEDDQLLDIIADKNANDEQKRQRLIVATANNADNHSAYLIHIERVENEESDALQPNDEPQARAANKALNDLYKTEGVMPEVTTIRKGKQQQQPQTTTRRPVAHKKSNGKKLLVPFIVILVAILTGFTIFNLMRIQKDVPAPKTDPVQTEDPNRIEFKKDDGKEKSNTTSIPVRKTPQKAGTSRNEQIDDEYNSILEDQERRIQQRKQQEKEKADKAKKEAEETQQQAAQKAPHDPQSVQQPEQTDKELHFTNGVLQGVNKEQSEPAGGTLE